MKRKSFLDDSDRNELSEILTSERLKIANVKPPTKKGAAGADEDLEEIFDHLRKARSWQGPKKAIRNRKAVRKLSGSDSPRQPSQSHQTPPAVFIGYFAVTFRLAK